MSPCQRPLVSNGAFRMAFVILFRPREATTRTLLSTTWGFISNNYFSSLTLKISCYIAGMALNGNIPRLAVALAALLTLPMGSQGWARDGFDFYVLSLSWSPSYCEAEGERANSEQCARARPFSFVIHGLWPQYERGWPSYCQTGRHPPSQPQIRAMLDVMPSRPLIAHQWRKHGSCSGLDGDAYLSLTRKALERIKIPEPYRRITRYTRVSPKQIEQDFINANPGLKPAMMAVTCKRRRLRDVRICLDKSLDFRPCIEVDANACRTSRIVLPPAR